VTAGSYQQQFIGSQIVVGTYNGQPLYSYATDAFVAKLSPSGALLWSTYIGGTNSDSANTIAVDASGNVWVCGDTASTDFPLTANAFQATSAGIQQYGSIGFLVELGRRLWRRK
jgi:hypothetical protein